MQVRQTRYMIHLVCFISGESHSYLHFICQFILTIREDHFISNRKVLGQFYTTLDHHGVNAIQKLVAKEKILHPVLSDMICKNNILFYCGATQKGKYAYWKLVHIFYICRKSTYDYLFHFFFVSLGEIMETFHISGKPLFSDFQLLPSGRWYKVPAVKPKRRRFSFVPAAIMMAAISTAHCTLLMIKFGLFSLAFFVCLFVLFLCMDILQIIFPLGTIKLPLTNKQFNTK